ncbi:ankyrin repeat-containing protein [Tanacetum coccineum]
MEARPELSMTTDISNTTFLHTTTTQGNIDVMNYLLEIESSLASIAMSNWKTTLHPASRNGHHRMVEALLEKAPGILGRNYKGQTALRMVAKGETERSTKKEAQNEEREKRAVVAERRIAALQCSKMIKGIILSANDFKNGTFDYKSCCKFHGNELATALRKRLDDGSIMAYMRKLTGFPSNVFGDQVPNCDSETDEAALVQSMVIMMY